MKITEPTALKIIDELVENRLIPFLGAGVSYDRLRVDWNALRLAMCNDLGVDPIAHSDPLQVADMFECQLGSTALADLMKASLLISDHDDARSRAQLCILGMNCGIVYTTNQDNVFEKMIEAKGREYATITSVDDLSSTDPTTRKYIKYHGDLNDPDSIIFTGRSYQKRIANADHFLNIRMRSDLLAKGFLFIGYSFNDPNVRLLFQQIRSAFPKGLPDPYLIAFRYDTSLEQLTKDFSVKILDPKSCFTETLSDEEAFNRLLETIAEEVYQKRTIKELGNFLSPTDISSTRIVIASELAAAKSSAANAPLKDAVNIFRVAVDQASIPTHLINDVVETVKLLSERVTSAEELATLPGLLFNLHLPPQDACVPIAWIMKAVNRHGNPNGMPLTHLVYPPMNSVIPGAVALAIASLKEEGNIISKGFLNHVGMWLQEFNSLPDSMKASTRELVTWAYGGNVPPWTFDKPDLGFKTFDQIMEDLDQKMPKRFRRKLTD